MVRTVVVAKNTRHNQIIAVLNDDTIDVKLLKVAGKFRVGDIATSIWCMTLRLYTLRAKYGITVSYLGVYGERQNEDRPY
jgi:hypothetical protein